MRDKELTKEESLSLITDMIGQAKRNVARGGSFYFLLWGWVVMLANLGHYLLDKFDWYEHPYIVWLVTIPATIASLWYGAQQSKKAVVRSHLDRLYGLIWLAVGIGILIVILFVSKVDYNINAIILILAGIGTFISGSMLRFNPLVIGSVALWISSIVAFSLTVTDQYLVGAVAVIVGYLIPGYLLKRAEREQV